MCNLNNNRVKQNKTKPPVKQSKKPQAKSMKNSDWENRIAIHITKGIISPCHSA